MSSYSWFRACAAILIAAAGAARADDAPGELAGAARPIVGVDRSYMDPMVSPCKNLYDYANGAFAKVPIPGEYAAYGVNQEIDERNFAFLKEILEESARAGAAKGSVVQRVGDFYASGMDEAAIEREGLRPLTRWFDLIRLIASPEDVVAIIALLQADGVNVGFHFDVQIDDKNATTMIAGFSQGGLGLPERDYYFREGKDSEEIRAAYVSHIARMLQLAGDTPAKAKAAADSIMAFETKLAKASRTLVDLRDPEKNYNKFKRSALLKLAPGVDWAGYFNAIAFPRNESELLVRQPEFLAAVSGLLKSEPITVWRDYLRWHLLSETADYLSKPFVDEHFAFYGKRLSGTTEVRPRWKRVLAAEDAAIGQDLGQLFVKKAFSAAAKARALTMVDFVKEAMRQRIRAATWMSETTKAEAYRKLDTLRAKIGYPDKWRDYRKLDIARRPYVLNALAADIFEFKRQMAKLGKPVDRSEWGMTPQTNNAYYDPTLNEMCFPAGILQPPFFDEKADDAVNYGSIGATIGHELTHGFDDQGRQYDSKGNLKEWWTAEDAKRFEERAKFVARQYDAYEPLPGLHLNGRQTLGENIADIGGLRVCYTAFQLATKGKKQPTIDGFTPDQRFFIAFAQSWRTNDRPESVRLHLGSDVHSQPRYRVLGSVAGFPEFLRAFGCPESEKSWPSIW
jgi:putative endopeptidase